MELQKRDNGAGKWEIGFNSDVDTKPFLTSTPSLFFEISFDRFSSFRDLEQFSQELRLASPSGQTFEWVVGAFYWSMDMAVRRENRFGNCGKFIPPNVVSTIQPCPAPFYTSGFFDGTVENDNAALFGQINWQVTDRFELFGGVRAVYENLESRTLRPVAPLPGFSGDGVDTFNVTLPLETDTDNDEYALTGRVGLSFDVADNARLFVSYARGFKGASVNVDNVSSNDTVDPEFVDSVEGGALRQSSSSQPYRVLGRIRGFPVTIYRPDRSISRLFPLQCRCRDDGGHGV